MKINLYPFLKYMEGVSVLRMFFMAIIFPTGMVFFTIITNQHRGTEYRVTHEVYFDIEIGGEAKGQIVIGLFGETVPETVQNFYTLATSGVNGYSYTGTTFHRVIKKFMIQGGDVLQAGGMGRLSIYGETFPDENFDVKHATLGFVAMANSGPNTNGCQFYITTAPTPWLDGKHVVFGKVIEGQGNVHLIEHLPTDENNKPLTEVRIAKSGSRRVRNTYTISDDPYNMWDWLKTISFPLSLSFSIIFVFNYFIRQLDKGIETEEALSLLKRKLTKGKGPQKPSDDEEIQRLLGDDAGAHVRKRNVDKKGDTEEATEFETDEELLQDELEKKVNEYKKKKASLGGNERGVIPEETLESICKAKTKAQ
ncbi:peptidyl-prolyl cis-trans isomerase C [Hyalella azteca]|uniref:peptidylprolyl isomerase n=1 Tax=Hyalella azteca TaxID=294128 RepID=A0A8B7P533_HYAAZ|nr:peptidyl-prolyl cis-trans isomerase C [Hyalella azteca]XP_018020179.1 peptidyl-prolyl cis-trans isomerase C [Hyalella azteca]XP_018020186.1 peptidyl-prolyl cis-trans isomerase C [Hyalella azteca]